MNTPSAARSPFALCLWLDGQVEEAAAFYTAIFPNSRTGAISRYGKGAQMPEGTALVATFFIDGQEMMALSGGSMHSFTPALSVVKRCENQAEIDHYWEKLTEDGGKPGRCGWLTDRFGVSWQIIPRALGRLMSGGDQAASSRVTAAFMPMSKLDLATLERAFEGIEPA
jgi:predicted 3-demethylubiquinone-9 3-methyltransferase (glyoxalase superfamily)